jgi:hypothetical protein
MKMPHLSQPKKLGGKSTRWQTPGCDKSERTPKGKLQNTTYIYGRGKSRSVSKPE